MTSKVPVTVVIAARNEAEQIGACVRSVAFAAEVLVVENDSSDATVPEATAAGATVFSHPFVTIGGQRNAAIARATQPWILVVDADERGTPSLGDEVASRLAAPHGVTAWRVPRRNLFLGREIRHGGWERDRPVRLFDRSQRYDDRAVHEHVVTTGSVGQLRESLIHVPYASLDEYMEKLGRYSRGWAAQHFARGRRASVWSVMTRPPARFFSMLVLRGGILDGTRGVLLAVLAAISVATKYAMLWDLGMRRRRDD